MDELESGKSTSMPKRTMEIMLVNLHGVVLINKYVSNSGGLGKGEDSHIFKNGYRIKEERRCHPPQEKK
jgi:hypothetical protein